MTRDLFTTEFMRCFRFVLQKLDRVHVAEMDARADGNFTPHVTTARTLANSNLDAAIQEMADHLYDALETAHEPNVT